MLFIEKQVSFSWELFYNSIEVVKNYRKLLSKYPCIRWNLVYLAWKKFSKTTVVTIPGNLCKICVPLTHSINQRNVWL